MYVLPDTLTESSLPKVKVDEPGVVSFHRAEFVLATPVLFNSRYLVAPIPE